MIQPPVHENDFRCEFDLPKFTDLRQTMTTRSQKTSILSLGAGTGRETMASCTSAATSMLPINGSLGAVGYEEDPNLAWFQEDHDFKIMTRAQMQ